MTDNSEFELVTDAAGARSMVFASAPTRRVLAALTYPDSPAAGTLIGPNGWGEVCVVAGHDPDGRALICRAVQAEILAAAERITDDSPSSILERGREGAR